MKKILLLSGIFLLNTPLFAQPATNNIQKVSAKDVKAIIDSSTGPLIINFWASWCGPCVREIPYFESRIAQLATPVKLILVSLDFNWSYPRQLNAFVKDKGYKSDVVFLNETYPDYFAIDKKWTGAIPSSIFVDNSKRYYRFFEMQLTEKRLELELNNMLN